MRRLRETLNSRISSSACGTWILSLSVRRNSAAAILALEARTHASSGSMRITRSCTASLRMACLLTTCLISALDALVTAAMMYTIRCQLLVVRTRATSHLIRVSSCRASVMPACSSKKTRNRSLWRMMSSLIVYASALRLVVHAVFLT